VKVEFVVKLEFQKLEFFENIYFKFFEIFFSYHSSSMENLISPNLSTQKVINPYIFPKQ